MAELKVSFEKKKNCLIIRLNGAFEGMDVMRVQDEIYGMLDSLEASSVVLDFAGVDYIDSAGIGTIFEMARIVFDRHAKLSIDHTKPEVKKVLKVTKVDEIVRIR